MAASTTTCLPTIIFSAAIAWPISFCEGPGAFGALAGGPSPLGFAGNSHARNQSLALGYTYSITPTLFADFRFGYYRYRPHNLPNGFGQTPALDAGLLGLNTGSPDTSGMPAFYINGDGGFDFGYSLGVNSCNCPLSETENQFQWVNNWTKQTGNHTIKWGADIRRAQQKRIDRAHIAPAKSRSIVPPPAMPEVDTSPTARRLQAKPWLHSCWDPTAFVQQIHRVRFLSGPSPDPPLLLRARRVAHHSQADADYGLRYENYLPQVGAQPGSAATFDPATGEVVVAGIGSVPRNMGIKPYNLGFAPRLGIAYQLTTKTVIRAGYGRSFNAAGVGAVFAQNPELDPPVQFVQDLNPPNPYSTAIPTFLTTGRPPPPIPRSEQPAATRCLTASRCTFSSTRSGAYRIPLADFWNFSVQHELHHLYGGSGLRGQRGPPPVPERKSQPGRSRARRL